MLLVFLDFDGVLHPKSCDASQYFCRLPAFEEVMREFPGVRVVITSTWRHAYSTRQLQRRFSADIAARIIGTTASWEEDDECVRYREILQYIANATDSGNASWIAVDDSDFEFPKGCANLLVCDPERGFDERAATDLRERLRRLT